MKMTQGSSHLDQGRNNKKMNALKMSVVPLQRETIHSGQFMVSDFEPESEVQDDEYEAGMPIPPIPAGLEDSTVVQASSSSSSSSVPPTVAQPFNSTLVSLQQQRNVAQVFDQNSKAFLQNASISIDGSLTKLFQCMSLAYRQKLTSPKWNRFKGVRLRWKDKIRLNNIIWRGWFQQFILKQKTLVCQFASPLDVDQHNKPEAVVMEGKYWKRKLSTVAAEYKKWRLFYRNKIMGWNLSNPTPDLHPVSLDGFDWNRSVPFGSGPISNLIFDDDFLMDFSDTLFSSLSSNQFPFPNPRELVRGPMGNSTILADFLQPGLVQLQPNLDDFMDTLEVTDYVNSKLMLPPVPEELDTLTPQSHSLLPHVLPPSTSSTSLKASIQQQQQQQQQSNSTSLRRGQSEAAAVPNHIYSSSSSAATGYYTPEIAESSSRPHGPQSSSSSSTGRVNAVSSTSNVAQSGVRQSVPSSTVISPSSSSVSVSPSSSSSSSSSTSKALLKDHSSSNSTASNRGRLHKNNGFAVPKGEPRKPRGRARLTPVRPASTAVVASCPPPVSVMSHQPMLPNPMAYSQMPNSNTLLSHLLTNSAGTMDKTSNMVAAGGSQMMGSNGNNGNSMMPNIGHLGLTNKDIQQQHQQHQSQNHQTQPWNPKNANETINPNTPINFGLSSKNMMQSYNQSMNVGVISTGGNVSPPLLSNTPSPPHMGPPGGPSSPKSFRSKDSERVPHKEHRRVCHINAEQKRRCNIKNGFDMLHSLIPQLSSNPNAKVSKAAMLQKGAEYIRQLKMERATLKEEIEAHRQEVEALNQSINNCQSMLPATGAPVSRQRTNKMKEMFDHWVRMRTTENWKFWIFSILIRPLLDSYNNSVSTASVDELCRTVVAWVDQHCSLVDLRPAVLNSLRYLCTTTDILTAPGNLPEEAYKAVNLNRTEQPPPDRDSR